MRILVTGCAGFIGAAVSQALLDNNDVVIGVDNLNDYYDVSLKQARLSLLSKNPSFHFSAQDICDTPKLNELFLTFKPQRLIHLAAQAGVRYSIENPYAYGSSNLVGFINILEACRKHAVE